MNRISLYTESQRFIEYLLRSYTFIVASSSLRMSTNESGANHKTIDDKRFTMDLNH